MVDKKLVATTVSSRDVGMQRRIETVTTSSYEGKKQKKKIKSKKRRTEFISPSKSEDCKNFFCTKDKEDATNNENGRAAASIKGKTTQSNEKAEAVQIEATDTWVTGAECSGSSSKVSPQTRGEELQDKTTFIVLQKNTRSLNSSERLEELFSEILQVAWDVILISQALNAEERFDKKRLGYINYAINKSTGIKLHWIQMNLEKRSVTVYGQLAARIENNGFLKYYKHEDVEGEVRNLMDKWLTKNL